MPVLSRLFLSGVMLQCKYSGTWHVRVSVPGEQLAGLGPPGSQAQHTSPGCPAGSAAACALVGPACRICTQFRHLHRVLAGVSLDWSEIRYCLTLHIWEKKKTATPSGSAQPPLSLPRWTWTTGLDRSWSKTCGGDSVTWQEWRPASR